jgi:hypothetical protein
MPDIFVHIDAEDYDAWLKVHNELAEYRRGYGIEDGPLYRGIDEPNTALFHARVEDVERAMEWFRSDTLRAASPRATVTGRTYYVAEPREPGPADT